MTIFIAGSSRSGTTMLGRILGRHPEVFTFHELHFFESIWEPGAPFKATRQGATQMLEQLFHRQRVSLHSSPKRGAFSDEIEQVLGDLDEDWKPAELFRRFLGFEVTRHGAKISCEQTPRNAAFADTILKELPDAHLVWMVRDPRNVLLSQKNKWKRARFSRPQGQAIEGVESRPRPARETVRSLFSYHPYTASRIWRSAARSARGLAEHPRVHVLLFESLISSPHVEVQKLCDSLGVRFEEQMLEIPAVGSSHKEDAGMSSGVSRGFAGSWEDGGLDTFERKTCEVVAAEEMSHFGYAGGAGRVGLGPLLKWALWTPFHLAGALLLNLGRGKSTWRTLRRRLAD